MKHLFAKLPSSQTLLTGLKIFKIRVVVFAGQDLISAQLNCYSYSTSCLFLLKLNCNKSPQGFHHLCVKLARLVEKPLSC